jgi:hypothetical protein
MSVLTGGRGANSAVSATASGDGFVLEAGKSHGPLCHVAYKFQPANVTATARKILSSEDRVKIALPLLRTKQR